MESARSFLFSILSSFFLVHPRMTGKARNRKQKVVIVGGGVVGSLLARELSSKLNREEHELVLIETKPYAIWLIAGARLVTEQGCHPGLEERAFVPYDKLFYNGNGSVKRGKVVSIHSYSRHTSTDTRSDHPDGGEVDTSSAPAESEKRTDEDGHSGYAMLEGGEKVLYDALILATGSKYSGPVDFPDDPAQCRAHLERWRTAFKEAKNIMLVGGGGVAVGQCSMTHLLVVFC
jgi:NADH dehydrogenase FAD-containing subunit